jgi:hypothetical protein
LFIVLIRQGVIVSILDVASRKYSLGNIVLDNASTVEGYSGHSHQIEFAMWSARSIKGAARILTAQRKSPRRTGALNVK